jgi:Ca2+-binding RTX toxin-like protein
MPSVRVERLPVQTLGLGILGFDHLQLVYVTGEESLARQDDWFVIEGLREPSPTGLYLGVEGHHGGTTLAEANGGLTGQALADKVGTSVMRGSLEIASGPEAPRAWATFAAHASDIDAQRFPYIAYALPSSPLPTINSSSLVSSLLHYAGIDPVHSKPSGLRFSPGTETLLGSSGDDVLAPVKGFTTVVAGDGADWLTGSFDARRIDKLYGGRGDDHFQWSKGVNIIHGGQPELAYAHDGRDTADYSGVRSVTITASPEPLPHKVPDFVATFDGGEDRLFSIEEIVWDGERDRVLLGKGAGLIEAPVTLTPGGEESGARGDILDLSHARHGLLIDDGGDGLTRIAPLALAPRADGYQVMGAEWIIASPFGDRIHANATTRGIEAGGGDDVVEASGDTARSRVHGPRGFDVEIDGGAGADTIISGAGRNAASGGEGADTFVLGAATSELVIEDAEPWDRVSAPYQKGVVRYEADADAPGDLLIHVGRSKPAGDFATIRVRHFHDGDLGLDRSDPGSWTTESAFVAAARADQALPSRPSMPAGDAAFHYPDSTDTPALPEPDWWWVTVPLADVAMDGSTAVDAPHASAVEILWHTAGEPPHGHDMDDAEPCCW